MHGIMNSWNYEFPVLVFCVDFSTNHPSNTLDPEYTHATDINAKLQLDLCPSSDIHPTCASSSHLSRHLCSISTFPIGPRGSMHHQLSLSSLTGHLRMPSIKSAPNASLCFCSCFLPPPSLVGQDRQLLRTTKSIVTTFGLQTVRIKWFIDAAICHQHPEHFPSSSSCPQE